jgi:glycosyltransferase involved in cell wall biosynthesis
MSSELSFRKGELSVSEVVPQCTALPDISGLLQPTLESVNLPKEVHRVPTITVVIPARDEARNLRYILPKIPRIVSEVILVDGHSSDATIAEAQRLLPSIKVIEQIGRGKGDALRVGFAASTGDIVITLDADGSADPSEIPCFVDALMRGNDFAKGSRFLKGGGTADITRLRYWGNAGLSVLVNTLFGATFSDLCYGYNAFWRHCLDRVSVDCDGFEVETLLNLRMHLANVKLIEVPSFEHARIFGESKLRTWRDGWRVLLTILREWAKLDDKTRGQARDKRTARVPLEFSRDFSSVIGHFDIRIHISVNKMEV